MRNLSLSKLRLDGSQRIRIVITEGLRADDPTPIWGNLTWVFQEERGENVLLALLLFLIGQQAELLRFELVFEGFAQSIWRFATRQRGLFGLGCKYDQQDEKRESEKRTPHRTRGPDRRNGGKALWDCQAGGHKLPARVPAIRMRGRRWDLFARPSMRGKVHRAMSR